MLGCIMRMCKDFDADPVLKSLYFAYTLDLTLSMRQSYGIAVMLFILRKLSQFEKKYFSFLLVWLLQTNAVRHLTLLNAVN